jgi:hypothetical protein
VQVDPIKPASKPTGTMRVKSQRYDVLLSNVAFCSNLRRSSKAAVQGQICALALLGGYYLLGEGAFVAEELAKEGRCSLTPD